MNVHAVPRPSRAPGDTPAERVGTLVIGAGQAGLAVGYELARRRRPFLIVDGADRIGDGWRRRWSSLRLFTPARYDALPGMPFPAPPDAFPTKDEMADYLEAYARRFDLPVRTGVRVERLGHEGGRFTAETTAGRILADAVVVAMSGYQAPHVPAFASRLDPAVRQLHASAYRDPTQLREGAVLIVGAGNSGAEIAIEVAASHPTYLAGRATGHLPFAIGGGLGRRLFVPLLLRGVFHRLLTDGTPLGRAARPRFLSRGGPLIRLKPRDLAAAGVERVPRVEDVVDGRPRLEDGRTLAPANVIWCTGFHGDLGWIDLPVLDVDGRPRQRRGLAVDVPGLAFVGQPFLRAASSAMIHGVARDAAHVVAALAGNPPRRAAGATRLASSAPPRTPPPARPARRPATRTG
jgi:putative flavoprotein involved in K+ transport